MTKGLVLAALGAALLGGGTAQSAKAKSAEWLARDHEIIRQMNLRELARVRARDARLRRGRAEGYAESDYRERYADYLERRERYAEDRRRYERRLAAWRACRNGYASACDD